MKHDVFLSHEGGDLSLGLLKKENKALPCNQVSPDNFFKTFSISLKPSQKGEKSSPLQPGLALTIS